MTIGKFFALVAIFISAFTFGSCSKDDDDEKNSKSGGHEYVDLGLPSGTLWATCNIGASQPEEYGDYFAWGEAKTKETYDLSSYKLWSGSTSTITKYCTSYNYGMIDNRIELVPEDDAANVNWGSSWCMPTIDQLKELYCSDYTTTKWTILNGVNGRLITSKKNGKTLFLPAAGFRRNGSLVDEGFHGCYWSRSLKTGNCLFAYYWSFHSSSFIDWDDSSRYSGFSVRPVRVNK